MAQAPRPSMRQLIQQRRRVGFVGRGADRAAFRANFDCRRMTNATASALGA